MIANNLDNDPNPKTMAMAELKEYSLRLDSIKGCNPRRNNHAPKRNVFTKVIPTLIFIQKMQ
jgi:hypothetical protein